MIISEIKIHNLDKGKYKWKTNIWEMSEFGNNQKTLISKYNFMPSKLAYFVNNIICHR